MSYRSDEDALTREIIELASEYGRYGYLSIPKTSYSLIRLYLRR